MRRAIIAITGTIAGLVALLSFKSHAPVAAAAGGSSASGTPALPQAQAAGNTLPAGEWAVDGNVANTVYGPVQIQLVVKDTKIVKVVILEQPSSTAHDVQIGEFAFPQLISETLTAQSAKIDAVPARATPARATSPRCKARSTTGAEGGGQAAARRARDGDRRLVRRACQRRRAAAGRGGPVAALGRRHVLAVPRRQRCEPPACGRGDRG